MSVDKARRGICGKAASSEYGLRGNSFMITDIYSVDRGGV